MSKIMGNRIKARDVKENVSIVCLLANLGFKPVKKTGKEHVFYSMFRDENTPSFYVYDKGGRWCDKGDRTGGNIIDLGKCFWKDLTFPEVLEKIVAVTNSGYQFDHQRPIKRQEKQPESAPYYHILKVQNLGLNNAITEYLQRRGVWQTAQGRLKEVYYFVQDEQNKHHNFFAAGWQNENGSWEVRSTLDFKACLGHKAISFIPGNPASLAAFEGFMDYLSWLSDNPFAEESVLVLNSISLLQAGITKAQGFDRISTYFDNDPSGREATQAFKATLPQTIDRSAIYEGYNDYNDKTVAEINLPYLNR